MRAFNWPPLSELDPVIIGSRNIAGPRLLVFSFVALLAGAGWGWQIGIAWIVAMGASETAMWFAAAPLAQGRPADRNHRIGYAIAAVASVFTLLSLSLLFWTSSEAGGRFIALAVWAVLLVNAIGFAFRSLLALMIFFAPVALVMVATPLILPRFAGEQQVMAVVGVTVFALYAGHSAYRDAMAARALNKANEALEGQRKAAEEANAAKSDFLAVMSHEIRTPLNGVLGMAQVMEGAPLPQAQRERLAVIQRSGETLLSLLNDLLDISRIESGRMELEDGLVDIDEIARGAREAFETQASRKNITLALSVQAAARGVWRGDPMRVRQIVHNLVSNAVKFTAKGSVCVRIGHDGEALAIEVADTGPGIALDRQATAFDRFVQADASMTRRFGGSGLGLAICRELAELMGGSVRMESTPGEGSTFTVRLPLAAAPKPARSRKAAQPRKRRMRLRILAAEDNPTNRLVLEGLLHELGAVVVSVKDGRAAVEAYRSGPWDVVLMDVRMPRMDGMTATRAIRGLERAEGRAPTPILALTANAMGHQIAGYRKAGMDGVITKPIQRAELIASIEASIADARPGRRLAA